MVLTDGENNAGRDVVDAIQPAGAAGFGVHFIGVGVERAKNARQIIAAVQATGSKIMTSIRRSNSCRLISTSTARKRHASSALRK